MKQTPPSIIEINEVVVSLKLARTKIENKAKLLIIIIVVSVFCIPIFTHFMESRSFFGHLFFLIIILFFGCLGIFERAMDETANTNIFGLFHRKQNEEDSFSLIIMLSFITVIASLHYILFATEPAFKESLAVFTHEINAINTNIDFNAYAVFIFSMLVFNIIIIVLLTNCNYKFEYLSKEICQHERKQITLQLP